MKDEEKQAMEDAAKKAKEDLLATVPIEARKAVGDWWAKHYLDAGHKRLARVLMEQS